MVDHAAVDGDTHAVIHTAHIAGHDDVGAAGVHFKHGVAGLGVFVDHVFHNAFQLHQPVLRLVFHAAVTSPFGVGSGLHFGTLPQYFYYTPTSPFWQTEKARDKPVLFVVFDG